MPQYRYQALNAEQQPVTGEVTAANLTDALVQLTANGLTVQSLADVAMAAPAVAPSRAVDDHAWREQLVQMVKRGRELLPPLQAFAQELPVGPHRRQLELLTSTLARDNITADEVSATLRSLPGYWIPLLAAATASRDPGRVLREFLRESQQAEDLRRQWWLTLAYPLLLIAIATAVLVGLSLLVIPVFREIFQGFGVRMPLLTRIVLTIGDWIASGKALIVIVTCLLLAVGLWQARRWLSSALREWWQDFFATRIGHFIAIARFSQFTADLLEAEVEPCHALRLAGLATGSGSIGRAANRVAASLDGSTEDWQAKNRSVLTRTVHYALVSPQMNSARVRLLREISASHAERMRWRLSWTRGLIEPLAILVVGLIVGGVALALFYPMFQLIHGLS